MNKLDFIRNKRNTIDYAKVITNFIIGLQTNVIMYIVCHFKNKINKYWNYFYVIDDILVCKNYVINLEYPSVTHQFLVLKPFLLLARRINLER